MISHGRGSCSGSSSGSKAAAAAAAAAVGRSCAKRVEVGRSNASLVLKEPDLHALARPGSGWVDQRNTLWTCKEQDLQRWAGTKQTESELLHVSPHLGNFRVKASPSGVTTDDTAPQTLHEVEHVLNRRR